MIDPRVSGLVRRNHAGPPLFAFLGDSLMGGSGDVPTDLTIDRVAARALGVLDFKNAQGGTGYLADGKTNNPQFAPYGDQSRVKPIKAANPDVLVIVGSLNDDEWDKNAATRYKTTLSKVYDTIRTYRDALPSCPIICVGPEPSSSYRAGNGSHCTNIRAVRDAVNAAGGPAKGLGFVDWVGATYGTFSDGSRVQFQSGATYSEGDVIYWRGSYYRVTDSWVNAADPGADDAPIEQLTAVMTGTGKVGDLKGDGTRDVFLSNDGTHPSNVGSEALGLALADCILAGLAQVAANPHWYDRVPETALGMLAPRPADGAVVFPGNGGSATPGSTYRLASLLGAWAGGGNANNTAGGISASSLDAAAGWGCNAIHVPVYLSSDGVAICSAAWQLPGADGTKYSLYNRPAADLLKIDQPNGKPIRLADVLADDKLAGCILLVEFAPGSSNQGRTNPTIKQQEETFWQATLAAARTPEQIVALSWAAGVDERTQIKAAHPDLRIVCGVSNNAELNSAGSQYDAIAVAESAEAGTWGNCADTGKPLLVAATSSPQKADAALANADNGGVTDEQLVGAFGYTKAVCDEYAAKKHWAGR